MTSCPWQCCGENRSVKFFSQSSRSWLKSSSRSFSLRNLIASPETIDLNVEPGWCDCPLTNHLCLALAIIVKLLATNPYFPFRILHWLTSRNSTEPSVSIALVCLNVSSRLVDLKTVSRVFSCLLLSDSYKTTNNVVHAITWEFLLLVYTVPVCTAR